MEKRVVSAGHICLDITPIFFKERTGGIASVLQPGKLIQMNAADVHTGGSVANTGIAMKLLGADVSLVGMVGDDSFGRVVLDTLKKYQLHEDMLVSEGESTSYTIVIAPPGIDRIFLHNPGANHRFSAKDIPEEKLSEAALFHFGYPPLMRRMYEENGAELKTMMRRAQEAGAATSMDMAAVDPSSDAGQADWRKILEEVLPHVDFFLPSAEELCFMLDKERFYAWQAGAAGGDITEILDVDRDIKPLAKRCIQLGAKVVLIKCGAKGMYYMTSNRERIAPISPKLGLSIPEWSNKQGFEPSFVPDRVLSGTGAGDTSIAAFLTAMLRGVPVKECVQFAVATGASCVTEYDALSGLKSFDCLKEKINAGWKRQGE